MKENNSGQAMIIAILTLGGALLGATTIAGLLMLYQIRGSTDAENSAKAIFAADSGLNWALYSYFNPPQRALLGNPNANAAPMQANLGNQASVAITCSDDKGNTITCDQDNVTTTVISEGISLNSRRAFFLNLSDGTSTLP